MDRIGLMNPIQPPVDPLRIDPQFQDLLPGTGHLSEPV